MPAEQVIAVGFVGDGTARAGGPNVCGAAEWRAAESLRVTREDGFGRCMRLQPGNEAAHASSACVPPGVWRDR